MVVVACLVQQQYYSATKLQDQLNLSVIPQGRYTYTINYIH